MLVLCHRVHRVVKNEQEVGVNLRLELLTTLLKTVDIVFAHLAYIQYCGIEGGHSKRF
jgi:hypothetical protein